MRPLFLIQLFWKEGNLKKSESGLISIQTNKHKYQPLTHTIHQQNGKSSFYYKNYCRIIFQIFENTILNILP